MSRRNNRYTENYKNMMKSGFSPDFRCCNKKVSIYNNNNTSNISNNLRKSQILQSSGNSSGCNNKIQYGNFGNVMNASPENNKVLQDLTTSFSENSGNFGNYVYIQNTINDVSNAECATPSTIPSNVNYNEFYTSFNNLRNVLNDQNINQRPFIFKNQY